VWGGRAQVYCDRESCAHQKLRCGASLRVTWCSLQYAGINTMYLVAACGMLRLERTELLDQVASLHHRASSERVKY
jgi:hypothetical protein